MATLLISSSAGIVSLLEEQDAQLKYFALLKLNNIVDDFWAEIADYVTKLEILHEDSTFKHRDLAALVVSKVYYNLGAYEEALNYALEAGKLFNVNDTSEYVTTMISKCLDFYIKQRLAHYETNDTSVSPSLDPRIVKLVDDMFQRCLDDGKYKQAIGIALEARRLDIIQRALIESDNVRELLHYTFNISLQHSQNLAFLKLVLRELINIYMSQATPDYINICQCLIYLDDPQALANILMKLLKSKNKKDNLMAYQMAFDAYACSTQRFLSKVRNAMGLLPSSGSDNGVSAPTSNTTDNTLTTLNGHKLNPKARSQTPEDQSAMDESEGGSSASAKSPENHLVTDVAAKEEKSVDVAGPTDADITDDSTNKVVAIPADGKKEDGTKSPATSSCSIKVALPLAKGDKEQYGKIDSILTGDVPIQLDLQFLIQNNKSDPQILKNSKDAVRNSICHNAVIIANGFVNCGTTSDRFLRNNLEWLAKATNWAKFTATASLGVIHKGHVQEAMNIMSTYLPKENGSGSPYSEGGSLYALGLIHVNHGTTVVDYLLEQLCNSSSEIIKHGACLGIGLATMGTARADIYEILKSNLYQDEAVIGEAAGLAMGLVMLGTKSSTALEDMIAYGKETRHEKILRGLILGISFIMFGVMEEADGVIDSLQRDKDPLLRRACVYTIAMAYCGTGSNAAIRKLLHIAVSDVNDDVRRSAVTCIGFLLFQTPEQCPNIVSLLAESYNPHVRYGAALALGIACAGTGSKEALNLIEPLIEDNTNYVRQGALIASSMILIQQNDHTQPKSTTFREKYAKIIGDKHEEIMAKFGALLAQGIIDAGGRNTTISYLSGNGSHVDVLAVVGTLVFSQFWFWYPFSHFLSLSFKPTHIVGLNYDLKMPKLDLVSNAKPSTYAYPPMMEAPKSKEKARLATVVLSYAKAKHHHHPAGGSGTKHSDKQRRKGSLDNGVTTAPAPTTSDKDESTNKKESVTVKSVTASSKPAEADIEVMEIVEPEAKDDQQTHAQPAPVVVNKRAKGSDTAPTDPKAAVVAGGQDKDEGAISKSPVILNESKKKKLSNSPISTGTTRPLSALVGSVGSGSRKKTVVTLEKVAVSEIEEVKSLADSEASAGGTPSGSGTSTSLGPSRASDSTTTPVAYSPLPEPSHSTLHNPARVLPEQLKVVSLPEDCRYVALKPITQGGIIMLYDTNDQSPEEFVSLITTSSAKADEDEGEEPGPPEPFQYIEE